MTSLIVTYQQAIATFMLNRPSVGNALDKSLITALINALEKVDRDPHVRVVHLVGAGKYFCTGGDLAGMKNIAKASMAENLADAEQLAALMMALVGFSKPIIAIAHGAVYGGGLGLLACCDMAIASKETLFCFSEARLGIVPAVISPYIIKAIGERNARRYFMTAEQFDAPQAQGMGLIHEVVNNEEMRDVANHMTEQLLRNGPKAISLIKNLFSMPTPSTLSARAHLLAQVRVSPEGQEGLSAFLEKRMPNWVNQEEIIK